MKVEGNLFNIKVERRCFSFAKKGYSLIHKNWFV